MEMFDVQCSMSMSLLGFVCCLLEADVWFGCWARVDGRTVGRWDGPGCWVAICLNLDLRGGGRVVSDVVGGGGCR